MAVEQPLPSGQALTRTAILRRVPPGYLLLAIFGALLLALRLSYGRPLSTPSDVMSVRYAFWMMVCFSAVALGRELWRGRDGRPRQALAMLRDWAPFVACLWVYENLHDLTLWIRPDTVDQTLARADWAIFGVQPTIWLERLAHPLLTDYLAVAYLTYFVFPPLLAGWLYLRGEVRAFEEFQLGLLATFYAGFLGYILVPAVGPHLILKESYASPLRGRFVYWGAKNVIATLQSFPRDCFPSLHTAVSAVTLFFLGRHRHTISWRWLRLLISVPVALLTVSLWFSTVYLRYHWVVDVFAGGILAAGACWAAIRLVAMWRGKASTEDAKDDV